jgi:hypothetical protein
LLKAEGWYEDPFGSHGARWFSDGTPTNLVRDHGQVSRDELPDTPYEGTPTPLVASGDDSADDLRRADDDKTPYSPAQGVGAVYDFFDQLPPN